jgi:hypothetical protein
MQIMKLPCIIVAIGDPQMLMMFSENLKSTSTKKVIFCKSWEEMTRALEGRRESASVEILTDFSLPSIKAMDMVEEIRRRWPLAYVINALHIPNPQLTT